MSTTPTLPDASPEDTVLSPAGWQAMLWIELRAINRQLTLACVLLGGILGGVFVFFWQYAQH